MSVPKGRKNLRCNIVRQYINGDSKSHNSQNRYIGRFFIYLSLFALDGIMRLMQILKNKYYQVRIFNKATRKCVRIVGEKGLTPEKLDMVENGLIKDLNWRNFWIETVEFNK